MPFTIEEIYKLAGRDDKVAVVDFIIYSESSKTYALNITVVFVYDQFEREGLEKAFREENETKTNGKVKARYLTGDKLTAEQINLLLKEGVNSEDIRSLFVGRGHENVFHEEKVRTIKTMQIPVEREAKGGDFDWMYGFKKSLVKKGIGLHPDDREWYLAMKKFYNEAELTKEETSEIYENGVMRPKIEIKYLEIKLEKEIISEEEKKKFDLLLNDSLKENFKILKKEINSAGLSLDRLAKENFPLYKHLIQGIGRYIPHKLNVSGKKPVYLDWKGYLHIFLRHVKEFEIGEQSKGKTKFLLHPKDVIMVMGNVIKSVDNEIQEFWKANPDQRFGRYRNRTLFFEGDYYTFHVEADGRLSTFFKSEKKL